MLPNPHGQPLGDAFDGLESFFDAVANAIADCIGDLARAPGRIRSEMIDEVVIGSIFAMEWLRGIARGDPSVIADVPVTSVMPLLALENLQLRWRIENLQKTLKQLESVAVKENG